MKLHQFTLGMAVLFALFTILAGVSVHTLDHNPDVRPFANPVGHPQQLEATPTPTPAKGIVLTTWDDVEGALSSDEALLIVAPWFENRPTEQDSGDLIWLYTDTTSQVTTTDVFSCFYEYVPDPRDHMKDYFECGPLHTEDQYDGSAVFYMHRGDLEVLFDYGAYAIAAR